jgi:hypothetical protein
MGIIMSEIEFENTDGYLRIDGYNDVVTITCQTKGSYDYGVYDLTKSEVDQVIRFLQKWESNNS